MTATDTNVPIHPAANLFPQMDAKAYREFVEDIKKCGLRDPIALLPDGALIDGRHRLRACNELGIDPQFVTVSPESPTAYVVSKNKHRRHLNKSQLGMLAAKALPHYKAEAKERMREGQRKGARTKAQAAEEVPQAEKKPKQHVPYAPDRAQERAAKDFGVNAKYVQRAVGILKHPDVAEKVEAGELSIDNACTEVAKRTGKRTEILENAAHQRAAEWLARIEGVKALCEKVSVEAIRKDARLLRHWREASRGARRALTKLLRRLEK